MDDEPELPRVLEYIWEWYKDLSEDRDAGFGISRIKYRDIQAWAELSGSNPTPWEVGLLRRLDREYLMYLAEKNATSEGA